MPTVTEAISLGRRRILAQETEMTQRLLTAYQIAWNGIERDLTGLTGDIEAARARGEVVDREWFTRQARWRQTQASIERQMQRFTGDAVGTVATTQSGAVRIAQLTGIDFRVAIDIPFAGRVNANAFERWVSALQPDSPIRGIIDGYGQRTSKAIERHMTEGLGSGKGAKEIVRNIVGDVGPGAVESRLATVVRTEGMRSFRGALQDDMEALGPEIIDEWQWISARGVRTCSACLAMDGRRFPYGSYPNRFHVACRCVIRAVPHASIVPPGPARMTGEEWLRNQPAKVQRRVLQSPERYDAFQEGYSLDDFTGVRHSKTWGPSVYIRPMEAVRSR